MCVRGMDCGNTHALGTEPEADSQVTKKQVCSRHPGFEGTCSKDSVVANLRHLYQKTLRSLMRWNSPWNTFLGSIPMSDQPQPSSAGLTKGVSMRDYTPASAPAPVTGEVDTSYQGHVLPPVPLHNNVVTFNSHYDRLFTTVWPLLHRR